MMPTPEAQDRSYRTNFNLSAMAAVALLCVTFNVQTAYDDRREYMTNNKQDVCENSYRRAVNAGADIDQTAFQYQCSDGIDALPKISGGTWLYGAATLVASGLSAYWFLRVARHRREYPHLKKSKDSDNRPGGPGMS